MARTVDGRRKTEDRAVSLGPVKRIIRTLAVIGGVVGVVWAMRERLISIPAGREPEPPEFRTAENNGGSLDSA
jgi:hypothetical protein